MTLRSVMRLVLMMTVGLLTMAAAARPLDRAAWRQDYAQLKTELVRRYPNLTWKASDSGPVDLRALDRRTATAIAVAGSDAEAADVIRTFVSGFHDGHLSELPTLAAAQAPIIEPDDPLLDADEPAGGCAALGAASTGAVAFSMPLEGLPGFKLVSDGLGSTFRSGLLVRSGVTLGLIRIQAFRIQAFPAACLHAWADLRDVGKAVTAKDIHSGTRKRWLQDLAAAVKTLHEAGATALLIDVGANSGGDDSGDWAARLFTNREVRSARLLMVDAPVAAGYFGEQINSIQDALNTASSSEAKAALTEAKAFFARQKGRIGKTPCDLSWVWREQRPWAASGCNRLLAGGYADGYRPSLARGALGDSEAEIAIASSSQVAPYYGAWSGPTYVLTDRRTYSSAEMFAAVMQDNHIAKLVGERTGGDGCGFMTTGPPIVLTHSHLRFRVGDCMRLRADGSNEEAGVSPDLPVLPTAGESDRARGDRAIREIVADLTNGR